jgi:signal transduction histidine kinase
VAARTKLWVFVLIALVLAQMAAAVLMPRGYALAAANDLIQGALLLVAAVAFLLNTERTRCPTLHIRLFWILMSAGILLWLTYHGISWIYFEVIKRQEVPDPFLGDIVLFLHLVPMIAALAVLPHLREEERDERVRMLDFTLLLIWWVFVYVYTVIPWQTVRVDEAIYDANLKNAFMTENVAFVVALAVLAYTAHGGWRHVYGQLFGASALYASSSYVANWAIGRNIYYSGGIYDIPLVVSMACMASIPLLALRLDLSDSKPSRPVLGVWITRLSMLALFSLIWAALHAELKPTLPQAVKAFRINVSLLTMVVMGIVIFWRQRLLRNELSLFLERSRRSLNDLKALQEKLIQSEKLASLGQLVGGAAHELNNPLTAMLGYSDLLSASTLAPQEQHQAELIGEQVRRTTSLVASLLTFARPSPANLAAVDVNSVLQTAMRLLAPQLGVEAGSVRLDLAPALPLVLADSNQILHVCLHLAGQIGAQLNREAQSTLLVRTHSQGNLVLVDFLSCDPSGNPALQSLSFQSASNSEDGDKPATLSLSACRRIVEEHGGRLLQPSTPGHPAFRMELQVSANSVTGSSPAVTNRAAARGSS